MLKIIEGRRYDTNTARLIQKKSNQSADKEALWEETLYRSKTGLWFLHCAGGKKTIYAKPSISPISEEAAVTWLTENFGKTAAQEVLCNVTGKSVPVTIQIPQALIGKIEAQRKATGQSRTDVFLAALNTYFL